MKHVNITTLGCKVNQCESAAMERLLNEAGYATGSDGQSADVVIINTCTVTGKAAMQSRQAVRQAVRANPRAAIVVTGCYAQTGTEEISAIAGVDLIVGHGEKLEVVSFLQNLATNAEAPAIHRHPSHQIRDFAPLPPLSSIHRTRAFLKIQDGCNTCCSYCIVPKARGRSRSMPTADVMAHLDRLGNDGFRETVLTGIHLGAYGLDLDPQTTLSELLVSIGQNSPMDRIRLSSIEPTEVDDPLIGLAADPQSNLCRHFHIPLQSGENGTLSRMGRPYTSEDYQKIVTKIAREIPGVAIGADVIVGFPGEDDSAFEATFALIQELPITYLHVFPFSPRKGTKAALFKDRVPDPITKQRSKRLRNLGKAKKKDFFLSQIGRHLKVLIETREDQKTGLSRGLSDNYIPVQVTNARPEVNALVEVRITQIHQSGVLLGKCQ